MTIPLSLEWGGSIAIVHRLDYRSVSTMTPDQCRNLNWGWAVLWLWPPRAPMPSRRSRHAGGDQTRRWGVAQKNAPGWVMLQSCCGTLTAFQQSSAAALVALQGGSTAATRHWRSTATSMEPKPPSLGRARRRSPKTSSGCAATANRSMRERRARGLPRPATGDSTFRGPQNRATSRSRPCYGIGCRIKPHWVEAYVRSSGIVGQSHPPAEVLMCTRALRAATPGFASSYGRSVNHDAPLQTHGPVFQAIPVERAQDTRHRWRQPCRP